MKNLFPSAIKFFAIAFVALFAFACSEDSPNEPTTKDPKIINLSKSAAYIADRLTLTGEGFGDAKGESYVQFAGAKATVFTKWTDSEIITEVPVGATSGKLFVYTDKKSNEVDFIVISQTDTNHLVQSLLKDTVKAGENLTIFGKNFGNDRCETGCYVDFGGVAGTRYVEWTDSRITVEVPATAVSGELAVVKNGKSSNKIRYTIKVEPIEKEPILLSLSKTEASVGDELTINGSNFNEAGDKSVFFGSIKVTNFVSWTNTSIIVKIPDNAVSGDVYVAVGSKISNKLNLTIKQVSSNPEITSMDKSTFKAGESLKITGKFFGDAQGTSYVMFGSIKATSYSKWTNTEIILTAPDGIQDGKLMVVVAGKNSNTKDYTVKKETIVVPTVLINSGNFMMGEDDASAWDTYPLHKVNITKPFYMAVSEITQAQWKTVMTSASNPSKFKNDNNPVEQVEFHRTAEFCNALSQMEGLEKCYTITKVGEDYVVTCDFDANGWRLPTEAEWEYAAKAGNDGYYGFDGNAEEYIVASEDGGNSPATVKSKKPNKWGLYDMNGNVAEWVWDWYERNYYATSPSNDPRGPESGTLRVVRGGSYQNGIDNCTGVIRENVPPSNYNFYVGFRIVKNK